MIDHSVQFIAALLKLLPYNKVKPLCMSILVNKKHVSDGEVRNRVS